MIIYKIKNKVNGKLYIGQTSKTIKIRFDRHIKSANKKVNRHLYDAMNFYGYSNFSIEEIESSSKWTNKEFDEREKYWIKLLNTMSPNGYNMTEGGGGGNTLRNWSPEKRKELYRLQGKKRTGVRSLDWRRAISEGAKKREASKTKEEKEKIKNKISETLKKKYKEGVILPKLPEIKYGKNNFNYIEIDIKEVCKLISLKWKLIEIAKKFNTSTNTIGKKLKETTGKTFIEWRNFYGIKGSFGRVQRLDPN